MRFPTFILKNRTFSVSFSNVKRCKMQQDYEAAIDALNSLQSNADYIKKVGQHHSSSFINMKGYMKRIGMTFEDLDRLSVMHVAGTKGKGSTCSLCESILRHHGYKTGLYTSPHLMEVRERIQINGEPISRDQFARQFFHIYKLLQTESKESSSDLPQYFRFLTLMAYDYFLKEKVDVAIIEVGIGGEYDSTNILRKVPVVGITSLGLDHTNILGDRLRDIAWQKAGIMKEGCRAFSVPQPDEAAAVLRERSAEKQCTLIFLDTKTPLPVGNNNNNKLPPDVFHMNVSLALALSEAWIGQDKNLNSMSPATVESALAGWVWHGRYEVRELKNLRLFLDGAHTIESVRICRDWYLDSVRNSQSGRALLFNTTGGRDSDSMLLELRGCDFEVVLFAPNVAAVNNDDTDNKSVSSPPNKQLSKCYEHKEAWLRMKSSVSRRVEVFTSVSEALRSLQVARYDLLVTGSLHLIGAASSLLR